MKFTVSLKFKCLLSSLYIVTSKVTVFRVFERFNNSIQARWKKCTYPAMRMEITATCMYNCINGRIYLVNKTVLPPNATSFTFTGLAPGTKCDFTLKAVYNPASIDDGISVTHIVLPSSKRLYFIDRT